MKLLLSTCVGLILAALLPVRAPAADAEGCSDLKLFPRLEGCTIVECSAKQHDSFEPPDVTAEALDADTNSLTYSCPATIDAQHITRELETAARKAGYLSVDEDKTDPSSPVVTAHKGSHWLRWGVSSEGDETGYWLTEAQPDTEKFKANACAPAPSLRALQHCQILECASKLEDSAAMHLALNSETTLTGTVQNILLSCPSIAGRQFLASAADELKSSGFEIVFRDDARPETGVLTARAGKRWMEIASVPDDDSMSYAITVVPSAEVLPAAKADSPVVTPRQDSEPLSPATPPAPPDPLADILEARVVAPDPDPQVDAAIPVDDSVPSSISSATAVPQTFSGGFVPPKPVLQVVIEPTHERIYSVTGEVVVNILVDVDESGAVTHAELTGRITKGVLKLKDAALEAASQWRFQPARQDGRIVAAVKIPIQMRFHGRPWRF